MADKKKLLGAAAFTVALAGGGVAGALMGVPGISGAQESTTTVPADDEVMADGPHLHERGGPFLDAAAEALGMTTDELQAELEAGKTIADVAGEKGVDVNTVIDAMVTSATDDLREHVTAIVNGDAPLGHHHGFMRRHPGIREGFEAAATALNMTGDELRAALEDGSTLAEVAEAQGVDVQTLIDAMVADANAHIDEKVASGDLTEEEAAEIKADLEARITHLVNNGPPVERGLRFEHGPRP